MENPCKIIFFGDSIIKDVSPLFKQTFERDYPEIRLEFINEGVSGETSRNGLQRIKRLLDEKPDIIVVGFGMNDWRKGVSKKEYKKNMTEILDRFQDIGSRVILCTVSPSYNFQNKTYNDTVDEYSQTVRHIAYEKKVKIADTNRQWKRELKKPQKALRDDIHPNYKGYQIICKVIMWIVTRKSTTILWQYNGREAKCNYSCPYCYYVGLHNPKDRFTGYIDQWHERFREAFGEQYLTFYLAHGEPTIGQNFFEILNMVGSEPKWQLRITSNISTDLESIVNSRAAQEGRLNINSSFHPCMIKRELFLKQILYLKDHGIEPSIVYVAYPGYLKRLVDDINFFRKHGLIVHIRRFQGQYKNKIYPWAYSDDEKKMIARYSDKGTIKYLLNQTKHKGHLTYAGLHFFIVDNAGNIGYDSNAFDPYTKLRTIFGNIHTGNFRPSFLPSKYPAHYEGTVDGIANIVSANYKELENNNVLCFSKQGGVFKERSGKIVYSHEFMNFDDPVIRANYNFPLRKSSDYISILCTFRPDLIKNAFSTQLHLTMKNISEKHPQLTNIAKRLLTNG